MSGWRANGAGIGKLDQPHQRTAGLVQGVTLLLPSSLASMAIVVLVPVLPLMLDHFRGLSGAAYRVPMLLTIPSICVVFGSPVAGLLVDVVSRRRLLIGSMAVYAGVGMLPLVLNNYWAILASRIGVGLMEALVLTTSTTLIGDFFSAANRDRWLGYQIAVASISATLLIFIGGLLSAFGWRGPFLVYGSALVIMIAVILFTWEPERSAEKADRATRTDAAGWAGFPWRAICAIGAITVWGSILFYLFQMQLPLLLRERGLEVSAKTGLLQALVSLCVPLGTVVFRYSSHLGPARLLIVAFSLFGIGGLGMAHASGVPTLLAAACVGQLGCGIVMPTLLTWAVRQLSFDQRGRGTGIWQGTFALGQFLMPVLVTFMAQFLGGLDAGIAALSFVAFITAALFLIYLLAPWSLLRAAVEK